ncbi:MAG TPA: MFS transporter [Allosphingosinicella sp.]|nr:MFS transporter [Allosphingosinicella sp.]
MTRPGGRGTETRADWLLVIASTVALIASVSHVYSVGVFIGPLEAEFGWQRGQISAGLGVISVISVVLAPFVGLAIDRFGSRRVGLPGLIIYLAGVALLSTASPSIWHWWSLWALIAIGTVLIKPTVWVTAIAGRFEARRGIALAVALCGTSIGAAILPFLTEKLLILGWRSAYLALAGGAALLALPMVYAFFRAERPAPRVPGAAGAAAAPRRPGVSAREGLTSAVFYKMAIAAFLATLCTLSLAVHFVPILIAGGISSGTAASTAGVVGVGSLIGRLGTGLLLDRFSGRRVGALILLLPILACVLLVSLDLNLVTAIAIGVVIGLSLGAEIDIFAFLSARYFGLANYGLLFGTVAGLISFGAGVGPTYAGFMFDHFRSYGVMLMTLVPMLLVSSLLVFSLGEEPEFRPQG